MHPRAERQRLAALLPRAISYVQYANDAIFEETLTVAGFHGKRLSLNMRIAGAMHDDLGTPERVLESIMDLYKLASRRWPFSFEQNIYFLDFIAGHVPRLWKTEMAAIGADLRRRFRLPEPAQVTCVLTGRRRGKTTISAMQIAICLICMPRFTCLVFCPSMNLAMETYQTVSRILEYFISALGIADTAAGGHPYAFEHTKRATPHPCIAVRGPGSLASKNGRWNEVSFYPSISKNGQVRLPPLHPLSFSVRARARCPHTCILYNTMCKQWHVCLFFYNITSSFASHSTRAFPRRPVVPRLRVLCLLLLLLLLPVWRRCVVPALS